MKKNYCLLLLVMIMMFASCTEKKNSVSADSSSEESIESKAEESVESEDNQVKHLAVLSPENILLPASLKGAVEIVPEDDGNVYVDFDNNNYPKISLTFKLLKNISTENIVDGYGQLFLVGHAQDAKGRNIDDLNPKNISSREWRSGDSQGKEFKGFLEGDVDNTITLEFTGENNIKLFEEDESKIEAGKKKVVEASEKFEKFKLSINQ